MAHVGASRANRYPTLDALRGIALISMVSAHISLPGAPTMFEQALHSAKWIDGAFYFVLLSGVVAGLVHRRIVERAGFPASARKLARRAGFIYLCQLFLVCTTITVATVRSSAQVFNTPTWGELGGVAPAFADILRLRIEPNFTGVLSMYVVFLLLAIPAVAALQRGWWLAVVGGSLGIYVAGKVLGGFRFAAWDGSFDIPGWQLLFMGGLLVGWAFEHEIVALPVTHRRRITIAAAAVTVTFLTLAVVARHQVTDALGFTVEKFNGGFLAFGFAAAAMLTAYVVIERARRSRAVDAALRPLQTLGLKGLPGYMAMVLFILFLASFPALPRNDITVVVTVIVCGFAEVGAVRFDAWRRARSRRIAARAAARKSPGELGAGITTIEV